MEHVYVITETDATGYYHTAVATEPCTTWTRGMDDYTYHQTGDIFTFYAGGVYAGINAAPGDTRELSGDR